MPRLPAGRGGHTILTDHRIAIYTPQELAALRGTSLEGSAPATKEDELVPWHNPPTRFVNRNLGLAYARVGRQLELVPFVRRGYELLSSAWDDFPDEPVLLRALGQIIGGAKAEADAQSLLEKALSAEPNSALLYDDMALAAEIAGDRNNAIKYLEKTLQLDRFLVAPYQRLATLYAAGRQFTLERQTYARFLDAFPENIQAKRNVLPSSGK